MRMHGKLKRDVPCCCARLSRLRLAGSAEGGAAGRHVWRRQLPGYAGVVLLVVSVVVVVVVVIIMMMMF